MTPESLALSDALYHQLLKEVSLAELRRARGLSQTELAGMLHVDQASISKLERRTDMYISTLRSHIEAMGGELEIIARFPDGSVSIANFNAIDPNEPTST